MFLFSLFHQKHLRTRGGVDCGFVLIITKDSSKQSIATEWKKKEEETMYQQLATTIAPLFGPCLFSARRLLNAAVLSVTVAVVVKATLAVIVVV